MSTRLEKDVEAVRQLMADGAPITGAALQRLAGGDSAKRGARLEAALAWLEENTPSSPEATIQPTVQPVTLDSLLWAIAALPTRFLDENNRPTDELHQIITNWDETNLTPPDVGELALELFSAASRLIDDELALVTLGLVKVLRFEYEHRIAQLEAQINAMRASSLVAKANGYTLTVPLCAPQKRDGAGWQPVLKVLMGEDLTPDDPFQLHWLNDRYFINLPAVKAMADAVQGINLGILPIDARIEVARARAMSYEALTPPSEVAVVHVSDHALEWAEVLRWAKANPTQALQLAVWWQDMRHKRTIQRPFLQTVLNVDAWAIQTYAPEWAEAWKAFASAAHLDVVWPEPEQGDDHQEGDELPLSE